MLTYYAYDTQSIYTAPIAFDPYGPIPPNSTPLVPPALSGTEVAQLQSDGWVVLAAYPPIPTPTPPVNDAVYTRLQFLFLFTPEEIVAVQNAAVTNESVAYYYYMIDAVVTLQLTDQAVIDGVNMLATQGVITTERAAQILAGDPAPIAP
tara:strand:- start:591 stop:1040 length:450 start_codon:yes stop_codon:yes gene_type:complete